MIRALLQGQRDHLSLMLLPLPPLPRLPPWLPLRDSTGLAASPTAPAASRLPILLLALPASPPLLVLALTSSGIRPARARSKTVLSAFLARMTLRLQQNHGTCTSNTCTGGQNHRQSRDEVLCERWGFIVRVE